MVRKTKGKKRSFSKMRLCSSWLSRNFLSRNGVMDPTVILLPEGNSVKNQRCRFHRSDNRGIALPGQKDQITRSYEQQMLYVFSNRAICTNCLHTTRINV